MTDTARGTHMVRNGRSRVALPKLPRRRSRTERAVHRLLHLAAQIMAAGVALSIGAIAAAGVPEDLGGSWYPLIAIGAWAGATSLVVTLVRRVTRKTLKIRRHDHG